jgi:hypothetical protein
MGGRMLIKSADDKQPQIDALNALLPRPDVDPATRRKIDTEIRQMRAGVAGERDAAYEIEFDSGPSRNRMTIHDLRLEIDGRVAQIDHLIITRLLDFWARASISLRVSRSTTTASGRPSTAARRTGSRHRSNKTGSTSRSCATCSTRASSSFRAGSELRSSLDT